MAIYGSTETKFVDLRAALLVIEKIKWKWTASASLPRTMRHGAIQSNGGL
jgi:hypothetical protein